MISPEMFLKATKNIHQEVKKLNLLWPGSAGKEVVTLQTLLNNCDYKVDKTGLYDDATTNAVKELQKKIGIAADGIAGPAFFNAFKIDISKITKNIKLADKIQNKNVLKGYKNITTVYPESDEVVADEIPVNKKSNVFVSYSHKDKKWLERLRVFIAPLEKQGYVNVWDDSEIEVGTEWKKEIENTLALAKAAVLLISADFMASKFIIENELPPLLDKSKVEGAKIIPVIISPCILGALSKYQAVNSPDHTLVDMDKGDRERVWVKVVENLTAALNN